MRSPLEHTNDWYELPDVAGKAPLEFLRAGWDWFVEQCEKHHSGSESGVINHYGGHCLSLEDDDDGRAMPGILSSFLIAVDEVAKSNPAEFVRITRPTWSSENAVVHKVLIQGLCLVAESDPTVGLEYLAGDARRLQVGTYESNQLSDSISLIRAIAPRLNRAELDRLEQTILSWSAYREESPPEGEQITWDRESRLRLLNAIDSQYLSSGSREVLEKEKLDLTGWDRERSGGVRTGFVRQLPPMHKDEMLVASNDEILKIIEENPAADRSMMHWIEVEGGWEEPGGAAAAGHEIAEMVKDNPKRAMEIVTHLVAHQSEEAATQAISGFADSSFSDDQVIEFLRALAQLNPQSEDLRSNIGYVLYHRCRADVGLPDDLCRILEGWLSEKWKGHDDAANLAVPEEESGENKEIESVLWSRGMFRSLSKPYFPLLALTYGFLMRKPPACELWLDAIERLIDLHIPPRTWESYCFELRRIRLKDCDKFRGASIIEKLFNRFPKITQSSEAIKLVAFIADLLPLPLIQDFLGSLRRSGHFKARLAYGELLTLIAFREQHDPWATEQFETELGASDRGETIDEEIAMGIAFAAANLWKEPQGRSKSAVALSRLIPISNGNIAHAIETVFWAEESFSLDEPSERLFNAFAENPTIFSTMAVARLINHLVPFAAHKRQLAQSIISSILRTKQPDPDLFEAGPDLVKIAMTLQRFPDTRAAGLTLLEEMLRTGLDDAFRVLRDIDIRPVDASEVAPVIRRPKARRKYKRQAKS